MPAGDITLDDEAVDAAGGLLGQGGGEGGRGDDGEELRAVQLRSGLGKEVGGIEAGEGLGARGGADHIDGDFGGLTGGEAVEGTGNLARDAGAHEHVVDAGQHGAVERGEGADLDLLEQVNADRVAVSAFGEMDLGEVGDDGELGEGAGGLYPGHRDGFEGGVGRFAAGDEEGVAHALGDRANGETFEGLVHVAAGIPGLEAAGEDDGEQRAGNDTELAELGDGTGEAPIGDGDAHASLNDLRLGHGGLEKLRR